MTEPPKAEWYKAHCKECNQETDWASHDWPKEKIHQCQKCGTTYIVKKK
jgi:ribosomal protein S27E